MSRWARALLVLAALVVLGLGYVGVSLLQVWQTGRSYSVPPGRVVVVLGAAQYDGRPSPQLAARLDEVLRIWDTGVVDQVMVTGGRLPGDRFTEAEASARYLTAAGIPPEVILAEDVGTTTFSSLQAAADILSEVGVREVVLVTDPFHALRSQLIAAEVGLDAVVAPTSTSVVRGGADRRLHLREALGVALGRIIGFERLTNWVG